MTAAIWAIATVFMVAIVCFAEMQKAKHRAQHGITTDMMGNEKRLAGENNELKREVEDLRERIKVLERIATDDRAPKRLSAEIEALRETEESAK